jgi:hypothetical protein
MRSVVASGLKNASWAGFEYRYAIYENLNGIYLLSATIVHIYYLLMLLNRQSPEYVGCT